MGDGVRLSLDSASLYLPLSSSLASFQLIGLGADLWGGVWSRAERACVTSGLTDRVERLAGTRKSLLPRRPLLGCGRGGEEGGGETR